MRSSRWNGALMAAGLLVVGATLEAPVAHAQCTDVMRCNTVSATAKGAIGGGILGAEIGFIVPALLVHVGVRELDEWWSWVLFPTLGAVGGSILGYFSMEDPANGMIRGFPEVAVTVLAISMALIVPTFVGVLALTSYNPGADSSGGGGDEDEVEEPASGSAGDESDESEAADEETQEEPSTAPATPEPATDPAAAPQSAMRRMLAGGPGLLRFAEGAVLLGVPMVHGADTFTTEERERMQLGMATDIRVPVVSGTF